MKLLYIPLFTLLVSFFIVGTQSQAETKPHRHVYWERFPSALDEIQKKLYGRVHELNEIKHGIGMSSWKASKLLKMCEKILVYLEKLLETSSSGTSKCMVAGSLSDPVRGLCYLPVFNPPETWHDANDYCHDLGGVLLQPLPADNKLTFTLVSLFPELLTATGFVWIDGVSPVGTNLFTYASGFIHSLIATSPGESFLRMSMPLTTSPTAFPVITEATTGTRGFICQFEAITIFPPFSGADIDDGDDTHIPNLGDMVDVETGSSYASESHYTILEGEDNRYHHGSENPDEDIDYTPNEYHPSDGYSSHDNPTDAYSPDENPTDSYTPRENPYDG